MINGDVNEFIDCTTFEHCALLFQGRKYFFYGLICDEKKIYSYDIDLWDENDQYVATVFNEKSPSAEQLMETFYAAKIWDNKTFWEVEKDMEWIDW